MRHSMLESSRPIDKLEQEAANHCIESLYEKFSHNQKSYIAFENRLNRCEEKIIKDNPALVTVIVKKIFKFIQFSKKFEIRPHYNKEKLQFLSENLQKAVIDAVKSTTWPKIFMTSDSLYEFLNSDVLSRPVKLYVLKKINSPTIFQALKPKLPFDWVIKNKFINMLENISPQYKRWELWKLLENYLIEKNEYHDFEKNKENILRLINFIKLKLSKTAFIEHFSNLEEDSLRRLLENNNVRKDFFDVFEQLLRLGRLTDNASYMMDKCQNALIKIMATGDNETSSQIFFQLLNVLHHNLAHEEVLNFFDSVGNNLKNLLSTNESQVKLLIFLKKLSNINFNQVWPKIKPALIAGFQEASPENLMMLLKQLPLTKRTEVWKSIEYAFINKFSCLEKSAHSLCDLLAFVKLIEETLEQEQLFDFCRQPKLALNNLMITYRTDERVIKRLEKLSLRAKLALELSVHQDYLTLSSLNSNSLPQIPNQHPMKNSTKNKSILKFFSKSLGKFSFFCAKLTGCHEKNEKASRKML